MSRGQQRYNISNPSPFNGSDSSYQPSQSNWQNGASEPDGSPQRPARSRMRDAPAPPGRESSRANLNVQTGGFQQAFPGGYNSISPISPVDDAAERSQDGGMFSDPFANDRSHRNELRAHASAAVQQASNPFAPAGGPASDKLRNVVGAFMSAGRQREDSMATKRPARSERRPKAKDEVWDIAGDARFAEIDSVLGKIRRDWPFVLESDFSPSTLALSLLSESQSSSLPRHPPLGSFVKVHESLSVALQSAVQGHFQTFAASLPSHASFLSTLGSAQQQVKKSREELKAAREGFGGKGKSELAGVRGRERQVRDMLKILDTIDNLKQIPDRLEFLIGEKRFLKAALLLLRSLKAINRPEVSDIGALADLRAYFTSQETILTDILVEELHNHIYLKTFYSDARWRSYIPGQESLPVMEPIELGSGPRTDESAVAGPGPSTRFSRYLSSLSGKPNQDPALELESEVADAEEVTITHKRTGSQTIGQAGSSNSLSGMATSPEIANPEAESFSYMETLLEALAVLGRLGAGLETLAQRVPGEIHALVEATIDEVEDRSEQRREEAEARQLAEEQRRRALFSTADGSRNAALDVMGPPRHAAILRDLFWSLYSKLAAVLEGHRVVYEVSRWISSRRDFRDNSIKSSSVTLRIPVLEIWKPVQHEVRTLLANYLTDESKGQLLDKHPLMSINEVLKDGKIARDRQKPMFKFADTDARLMTNETKLMDDSVQQALKTSVPGLVSMQLANEASQNVLQGSMANSSDQRYSPAGKHKSLIPPNAFNVTTLFQPTLAFIERANAIIPAGYEDETSGFGTVLEDFVVRVFLPQLDERVTGSFQQAVSGYDAFQVDRNLANEIAKPPLKSSVRVMALVHSLCVMLNTTPFHRENYSRLIVGIIVQYYQQCSARFKELATLDGSEEFAIPAVWAQREDVTKCLSDVRAVIPSDRQEMASIAAREVKLEVELLGNKPLIESKLIQSLRKLEGLGNLAESLKWFVDSLLDLQSPADEPLSPGAEMMPNAGHVAAPLLDAVSPRLPLTRAMSQRYEAIVQTYEQLADMVLNTIRLEIRGRVICNLSASLKMGDFRLESEALEPDPDVVDLNARLIESEAIAARTLSQEDLTFVFRGLAYLVDFLFISSAKNVKVVNLAGVRKIKRNLLTLQQSLRGISKGEEGILSRSAAYWDMYESGPKDMLETLRSGKPLFAFEDYNTMLNLQCKTEKDEAPTSELNTYLIDLHALSMSIEGWEIGVD